MCSSGLIIDSGSSCHLFVSQGDPVRLMSRGASNGRHLRVSEHAHWLTKPALGKTIFVNEINLICAVQSLGQKYSPSVFRKYVIVSPHPAPLQRGASRSSRTLGAGCDGRKASSDVRCDADGKSVQVWRPSGRCQVSQVDDPRGDGDNKARSLRGEHAISRKPSCRECRMFRRTCGD